MSISVRLLVCIVGCAGMSAAAVPVGKATKAVADRYYQEEARIMAPINQSVYGAPVAEVMAWNQLEYMQDLVDRLAELELQQHIQWGYTLPVIAAAIVAYSVYHRFARKKTS